MLNVLALAAESGNHTSVPSLRSLMTQLTETTTLRLAFAANTFEKAYVKRGSFSSASTAEVSVLKAQGSTMINTVDRKGAGR
jgi:hypothetical protein